MIDSFQTDNRSKGASEQTACQSATVIAKTVLGGAQPVQDRVQEQESAGVVGPTEQKGGAATVAATVTVGAVGGSAGAAALAATGVGAGNSSGVGVGAGGGKGVALVVGTGGGVATVAVAGVVLVWGSRPYFLRNLYRAMRETRTLKVSLTKSLRSARVAWGCVQR
jgi:hypothetical protein